MALPVFLCGRRRAFRITQSLPLVKSAGKLSIHYAIPSLLLFNIQREHGHASLLQHVQRLLQKF